MAIDVPDWVKDAVFYQIFPDRFAKSGRLEGSMNFESWDSPPTTYGFKGGDLYGAITKLDYLNDLGINAIYLNPIFSSTANHRYHTSDFLQVDPILGGDEAFKEFLEAAHARGMRVIIDGVFNHASRGFFQFNHTLENGKSSPYVDWFHFNREWLESGRPIKAYDVESGDIDKAADDGQEGLFQYGYRSWWGLPALPKFNTDNYGVRQFLFEVARKWMEFGADGWRLDVPSEINDPDFWQRFRHAVKSINPDAYIVGEIWTQADEWLQGDRFDAVMNYHLGKSIISYFFGDDLNYVAIKNTNFSNYGAITTEQFHQQIEHYFELYDTEIIQVQMNLLASHDTPRLLTLANENRANVRLAMAFLFTFPGAPCFYYGDEVGMLGNHDPDCRRTFPVREDDWDHDMLRFFKQSIALRHRLKSLRRGDFKVLQAEGEKFVFSRTYEGETTAAGCLWGGRTGGTSSRPTACDPRARRTTTRRCHRCRWPWPCARGPVPAPAATGSGR